MATTIKERNVQNETSDGNKVSQTEGCKERSQEIETKYETV